LPDGTTTPLITIKDWDFRWQHVYRLVKPLVLPRGTIITARYLYDNTAGNPRNPQPAARVEWGQRSGDEMGDLWIQVLTRDEPESSGVERGVPSQNARRRHRRISRAAGALAERRVAAR
jgi:hypothetical protein